MAACSKYVRNAVELVSKKVKDEEDTALVDALLAYKNISEERPVLIAADDYTASVMDQNKDKLSEIFVLPGIISGDKNLSYYMDKSIQCKVAESVGMRAPKCWVVSLRDNEIQIPEDMVYPCFCKPIESFSGYKQEMKKCNNRSELSEHLYLLQDRFANRDFLVQEFVNIDNEIDIEGVAMGDTAIMPGVVWKDVVAKYEVGVPLAGKMVSWELFPGLKERVAALLAEYNYFGMFDLGINIVGDQYYFNEINLRSGGTNYVYFKSGVNLPELFVKAATNETITQEETVIPEFNKTYFYELMGYDDYFHDLMTREELDDLQQKADIKILQDEADPKPYQVYMASIEKTVRRKELLDRAATEAMKETGWTWEEALANVRNSKRELGIKYRDYRIYKLWRFPIKRQQKELEKGIRLRERRKQLKAEAIAASVAATGWSEDQAEKHLMQARENFDITYREYKNNEFWQYETKDEQNAAHTLIRAARDAALMAKITDSRADKEEGVTYEKGIDNLVVVLSRNYSTGLAVIRSLGSVGYTVDLVASAFKEGASEMAACSKYVRNSVEVVSKKVKDGGDTELVDALLAYRGKNELKPVLFATDDYTASIMDQNRDALSKIFIMPGILGMGQGSMTEHMDKTVQGEIARKVGLLTPKEWIIPLYEDEITIPEDMVYPCFCKPIESITGYKSEMAKCEDEDQLYRHLSKLRRKFAERSILVQEFLTIDNEIDLGGVCLGSKVIIPAIIKKTHVAQYEKGVTLAGVVVPFEEMGAITEKVVAMLKEFHYFGMFDMEFNIVGDKIYFNEVNLRSGGPNFSYFKSGVNLPKIFVDEAMGKGHTEEEEKVSEFGKDFIYEKVAWDDHIHGFMTKKELDDAIDNAKIKLLYSDDDTAPVDWFIKDIKGKKRKYQRRQLKKTIKNYYRKQTNKVKPPLRKTKHVVLRYPQMSSANARSTEEARPRVMVAGRNYLSNLCMAKSLGMAGYEVEVLRIFQTRPKRNNPMKILKPDAYSKHIKAYYVCVSKRRSKRIRNRLITLADPLNKMLLIPCDDLVAAVIDMYYDQLKEYYVMPNVNDTEGEVNRLMEKGVQKELAKEAGLPVVGSCIIKSYKGEFEIPDTVNYPCFIKPNISKNSAKSKMKKCDSYEELFETLTEYAKNKDFEMIVEDFVEIEREFSILGVSTKNGAIGPGFFGAVDGGQAEHRGVALTGEILPVSAQQELIDKCVAFVGSLGFDGLYDVDLIQTKDGTMYFVEVNMRFGASGYAFTECGCNLPGMFADYMLFGKPIDMDAKVEKTGVTFVSEKVLIEEYTMGRLEKSEMKRISDSADIHFIKSVTDPKAYRHFKKFIPIAGLMRKKNIAKAKMNEHEKTDN